MNKQRHVPSGFFLSILIIGLTTLPALAGPATGLWPSQKGTLCWDFYKSGSTTPDGFVQMFVVNMGKGQYFVSGRNDDSKFSGSAEIVGRQVIIQVSSSGFYSPQTPYDGEVFGTLSTVVLDKTTLRGTVLGLSFHCDMYPAGSSGSVEFEGEQRLEPVPCH